jgi:hypothetical protein
MTSSSNINIHQNSEKQLDQLAAYSFFYQRAKLCLGMQFAVTVPAAVVISIIILLWPEAKGWTTFYALSVAVLDATLLDVIQSHYRKLGARTQELFDSSLLRIEWNALRVGQKPDTEEVFQAASKFKQKSNQVKRLRDWYPPAAGELPLPLARLICQRANSWWDSSLRKSYANSLMGIMILVLITVLIIALVAGNTMAEMLLSVYAPIAPAVLWSIREIRRQHEAVESLDKVKVHVEHVWDDALAGRLSSDALTKISREIQDAIFDGRARNPLLFDWINRIARSKKQITMNAKALELVDEARRSPAYALFADMSV